MRWLTDCSAPEWDRQLALLGGHPLQSALWGDARAAVDGIPNQRWAAADPDGKFVLMARVETRRIPALGGAAWIPRGPATTRCESLEDAHRELLDRLRADGYLICIDDQYPERFVSTAGGKQLLPVPHTIRIDLAIGKDRLLAELDSQWRYGVRAAQRAGVVVARTTEAGAISDFYALCKRVSKAKAFELPGSDSLMRTLCATGHGPDAEGVLFLAKQDQHIAAGALVMRCGRSAHYMWGATDREFPKLRAGEAVQWAVIEWCLENGLRTYDLEGIEPQGNPGTSQFKRKMGGKEAILPGKIAYPLNNAGKIALKAGRLLGKI